MAFSALDMRYRDTYFSYFLHITKTCLYNFDPLKPHIYVVKLGFRGVYIIFLISAQKHRLWYSLEPPRRGGSNEYPQSMFWAEIWKISEFFIWFFFQFLEVKFSVYLNRHVFLMKNVCCGYSWKAPNPSASEEALLMRALNTIFFFLCVKKR